MKILGIDFYQLNIGLDGFHIKTILKYLIIYIFFTETLKK